MDIRGSRERASERFRQVLAAVDQKEREAAARSPFVVTPESFFELFLLCLSWQADLYRRYGNWTTVDKVARILWLEEVITRKQRRTLFLDKRVQQIFKRHAELMYVLPGVVYEDRVAQSTQPLVIPLEHGLDIDPERMLRDCRIYITIRGMEMAQENLAVRYHRVITKQRYDGRLQDDREFRQRYHGRIGVVMANYEDKVERETSGRFVEEDEVEPRRRRKR